MKLLTRRNDVVEGPRFGQPMACPECNGLLAIERIWPQYREQSHNCHGCGSHYRSQFLDGTVIVTKIDDDVYHRPSRFERIA